VSRPLTIILAVALQAGLAWGASPALREQHTFTGEVRDIAILGGCVYAATNGGLAVHERADGAHARTLTSQHGLPGNALRVVETMGRRLVVGGDYGVVVLKPTLNCRELPGVEPVAGAVDHDRFDPVMAVTERGGDLFVLRHQTGIARLLYDEGGWRLSATSGRFGLWRAADTLDGRFLIGGLDGSLVDGLVTLTLPSPVLQLVARDDDAVVATGESIELFAGGRIRRLHHRGNNVPASAIADGGALIGTSGGGLYRLVGDTLEPVLDDVRDTATAVAADGEYAWIGFGRDGLHRVRIADATVSASLRPKGEICDNHVTSMTRHRGKLVAGTFDRGACYLDSDGWHPLAELQSPLVHGVASDGQYLWVANSNGIARYDARFAPKPVSKRDPKALRWLTTTAATSATEVAPGQVALTNKHGMVRIFRKKSGRLRVRFTSHDRGVPFAITSIDAAGGELFVSSEKEGVKAMGLAGRPARRFQDPVFLPENWVIKTSAVSADELWVATCQRGVAHVVAGASRIIDETRGLPDNMVTAVAADIRGAFIGTLWGLAWAAADSDTVLAWGLDHGVPDPRSASLFRDGNDLWLGTEAGLAHFELHGTPGSAG